MGATGTGAAAWVARPMLGTPELPGAVRWGVVHGETGRWVAFGSEARCRALVTHLTEVDAIVRPSAGTGVAGSGARR
jgi:hypothetical protein